MRLFFAGLLLLTGCGPEAFETMALPGAAPREASTDVELEELTHFVSVRDDQGTLVLTVRREFLNQAAAYGDVTVSVQPPEGAALSRFRLLSAGEAPAELLPFDEVQSRWEALTGPGDGEPRALAKLEWVTDGLHQVSLFGIAPGERVAFEYDLRLRPATSHGARTFLYRDGEPEFDLHRFPGARVEDGTVSLPHTFLSPVEARWAVHQLSGGRSAWALEVDAAPVLEAAPARPALVFVVDASHSQGELGIAAQLELIAPWLLNTPDAEVEVVLYRRAAERLFGRFVSAHDFGAALAAVAPGRLAPGNGSNLEQGAALAAELVRGQARVGRVVLLTDEQLRFDFEPAMAHAALEPLPADAVVHVVARSAALGLSLRETRDDEAALSPVAAARGGVFFRLSGRVDEPEAAAQTLLALARPTRIDQFVIEAPGLADGRVEGPDLLGEGEEVRALQLETELAPPRHVTLRGKVWARDFVQQVELDAAFVGELPAVLVSSSLEGDLTDDEVLSLATQARVVSRMTSFLSVPPDATPWVSGSASFRGIGVGTSSCGCSGGLSTSGRSTCHGGVDLGAALRALLAPVVAQCEREVGVQATGSLFVETWATELVDLSVTVADARLAKCLDDATWALRFSDVFSAHRQQLVVLPLEVTSR